MGLARTTFMTQGQNGSWEERAYTESGVSQSKRLSQPFLQDPGRRSRQVKRGLGRGLKWTARGLYLTPLLLIVKLGFWLADSATADILTVAFVGLVVAFFALLNLYVLAAFTAWQIGKHGQMVLRLPFSKSGSDVLELFNVETSDVPALAQAPPAIGSRLRVRGTVVELAPRVAKDEPVVRDLWLPRAQVPTRITEVVAFAVQSVGTQPVIVSADGAPTLLLPPERDHLGGGLTAFSEPVRKAFNRQLKTFKTAKDAKTFGLALREGDEVELVGEVVARVDNVVSFDLAGEARSVPAAGGTAGGSPYRHGSPASGVIVANCPEQAVVIRRLRPA
jgi:hypothetical protein